jgi:hypothetical protein
MMRIGCSGLGIETSSQGKVQIDSVGELSIVQPDQKNGKRQC